MPRPKRVLMIAPYFPPRRRVGARRPFRFAVNLGDFGWQPSVVTLSTKTAVLSDSERNRLSGISVLQLPTPMDRTVRSESSLNSNLAAARSSAVDRFVPVDTWLPLLLWHAAKIKTWACQIRPDAIWSTGDPWSSHVLAGRLAAELHLPWVADFRDPWTICPIRSSRKARWVQSIDRRIEKQIFSRADHVVFTAEKTRQAYQSAMPFDFKSSTIYNAFDEVNALRSGLPAGDAATLNLVFFGRFRELSPAVPVTDLLVEVKRRHPQILRCLRIHSFGPLTEQDASYAKVRGVLDCFQTSAPVRPEEGPGVLGKFDILLLSSEPARSEIIPAKLWDYLSAGRPILSLAANPEVKEILKETKSGVQFDWSERSMAADLLAGSWRAKLSGHRLPLPFDDTAGIPAEYGPKATTQSLATILDSVI